MLKRSASKDKQIDSLFWNSIKKNYFEGESNKPHLKKPNFVGKLRRTCFRSTDFQQKNLKKIQVIYFLICLGKLTMFLPFLFFFFAYFAVNFALIN